MSYVETNRYLHFSDLMLKQSRGDDEGGVGWRQAQHISALLLLREAFHSFLSELLETYGGQPVAENDLTLSAVSERLGADNPEIQRLSDLADISNSWVRMLSVGFEEAKHQLSQTPPAVTKTNVIATSAVETFVDLIEVHNQLKSEIREFRDRMVEY